MTDRHRCHPVRFVDACTRLLEGQATQTPGVFSLALVFAIAVLSSCSKHGENVTSHHPSAQDGAQVADRDSATDLHDAIHHEFLQIADNLTRGVNQYLGTAQVPTLKRQLQAPRLAIRQRAVLLVQLCLHQLRLGQNNEAAGSINEACRLLRDRNVEPSTEMLKMRAMAYLRIAESENCIQRHNGECCIFPLQGGGVHSQQDAARQAEKSFLDVLKREPDNLTVQWLLNVTCMALGKYPGGVPPRFRVPLGRPDEPVDTVTFHDIAPRLEIDAFNLCGGAIVADFDSDHEWDIVTSTFDPHRPLVFYRGVGHGRFGNQSTGSGLDLQLGGLNCLSADYDNDGDPDILVLRGAWLGDDGRIRNSLLRNDGNGRFVDVTREAGVLDPICPTQSAAWGDFDNDGHLDFFVGNESRSHEKNERGYYPCQLFRNNGDGTFSDIAERAGVTNNRFTKGVAAGDYNNDGFLDIYVSNVGPNRLYRNNGDGTFKDVALNLDVSQPEQRSFACWFFDFNNDGWLDIFVTGYSATTADLVTDARSQGHRAELPRLYRNVGGDRFVDATLAAGLNHPYLPMGANFGDINNDGYQDIYLATGDPEYFTLMPNVMLLSRNGKRFADITLSTGLGHLQKGHGVAFFDYDRDGDLDIYHQLGGFYPGDAFHNALFLNQSNNGNRFLKIKVIGTKTNRDGIGVRLVVRVHDGEGDREIHHTVGAVSSFGGSPLDVHLGLGNAARINELEIYWPMSKVRQTFCDVPLDASIEVREDVGNYRVVD